MPAENEIDEIMIALYYTGDDLVQASETLKSHDMPAFGVVENLVEEEVGLVFKIVRVRWRGWRGWGGEGMGR